MRLLKALLLRRTVAVASLLWFAIAAGCQGPDAFFRLTDAGQQTGTGGSTPSPGTAGTTGAGGEAGTLSPSGNAGTTGSAGAAGSVGPGTSGTTGSAGVTGSGGAAGSNTGGRGGTTGTAGRGGTTGTAGTTGSGGTTGAAGTTGSGGSTAGRGGTTGTAGRGGTTGAAGATGAGGASGSPGGDRIQVVAKCQGNNDAQNIRVTFKVLNPEAVAKQWSDIKVRFYFTANMPLTPMVTFDFLQKFTAAQLTTTATDTYVEIGFTTAAGMIAGYDTVTGSDQIQLRIYNFTSPTWNTTWTDDYSYKSCTGVTNTDAYSDRTTMPGYYQGQLAWGSEPYPP